MKKTSLEDRIDIPCLILCGGKSSRMKENKALLPFGEEKTLMEYQYKKFQKIFSKVYLVVKKDNSVTFTKDLIIDNSPIFAPTIGLESGFSQLNCQTIFFIPVDTPFVKKESVELLLKKHRENHSITTIGRTPSAKHSLVGFFNKDVLPVIKKIHKEEFYKVGYIHNEVKSQIISFSDDQEFFNVNTPDDYKESINLL